MKDSINMDFDTLLKDELVVSKDNTIANDKSNANEKKGNTPWNEESKKLAGSDFPENIKDVPNLKKLTNTQFFTSFEVPDNTFWAPKYITRPETVKYLLEQYTEYTAKIRIAYANAENQIYFEGFSQYHKHRYLLETLAGEGNIDGRTSLDELEKYVREPDGSRTSLKINNLKKAMGKLFPNVFQFVNGETKINFHAFTPELIIDLHKQIMFNLVDQVGAYRTCWAAPSQENWLYLVPEKISEHLDVLCTDLRIQLENESESESVNNIVLERIKIVANFLTHFLQIHPFANGNGRVARLLVSWLMADLTVVPVPLLTTCKLRKIYLDCLRDSRCSSPFVPANLARFVFENVINTLRTACVSLDI